MIGRLNHVAVVVSDLQAAMRTYREDFGAEVSDAVDMPEHGVTTAFVKLPNTTIELLYPLGTDSPLSRFLERSKVGGIHHLCLEVEDIERARARLTDRGFRVLGDGRPSIGAHGKSVLFLHPKDVFGVLIELEEA